MPEPAVVASSPLLRARDTASAYAEPAGIEVRVEDDLAEAHLGEWEGKSFEEILSTDEQMLHRVRNQEPIWRHAPFVEDLGHRLCGSVRKTTCTIAATFPCL